MILEIIDSNETINLTIADQRPVINLELITGGPTGPAGPPGATGPTGPTGPQGPPGTGSGSVLNRQAATSTVTMTGGLLTINPSTPIATMVVTLPTGPSDQQIAELEFGGTITSGIVVIQLQVNPNVGQGIVQAVTPDSAYAGEIVRYAWNNTLSKWFRKA